MAKDLDVEAKAQVKALEDAAFERGKAEATQDRAEAIENIRKLASEEGKAAGAKAERERIQAVEAQALPGHEALIAEFKFDGKTTGAEAALRILAAEKTKRERVLANLKGDAPPLVPAAIAPEIPAAADANLSIEKRAQKAWDNDPKLREEFSGLGAYTAFLKAEAEGKIRIYSKSAQ